MVASLVIGIIFWLQVWDFVTGLTAGSFTGAALWEQRVSSYESSVFIKLIERVGKMDSFTH